MYEIINFSLGIKKKTGQEILRAIVSLKKFSYDKFLYSWCIHNVITGIRMWNDLNVKGGLCIITVVVIVYYYCCYNNNFKVPFFE